VIPGCDVKYFLRPGSLEESLPLQQTAWFVYDVSRVDNGFYIQCVDHANEGGIHGVASSHVSITDDGENGIFVLDWEREREAPFMTHGH